MGVIPLMWAAFAKHAFFYKHTWMTTVGWDPVKKTSGISPHLQKLIPYCIDTFVVIPLAIFCCVSILMLKLFSTAQIPLVDILSSGGIGLIVITALILEVVFLCGGTNVVHCTNSLIRLDPQLRSSELMVPLGLSNLF